MKKQRITNKRGLTGTGLILAISLISLFLATAASMDPPPVTQVPATLSGHLPESLCSSCEAFHNLNTQILNRRIDKNEAMVRFKTVMKDLKIFTEKANPLRTVSGRCVFPLRGYAPASIGGKNGSGYIALGYDYFDGNNHGGHPAHDLFIRDSNQDSRDDVTGEPVSVLAMENGLVISVENTWEKNSLLRGGRYLWIYNPRDNSLTYYAHNDTIVVRNGDWVKPGQPIATVGRTGYNASQMRSPTHLHLMHLKIENGLPRPENRFSKLSSCTRR